MKVIGFMALHYGKSYIGFSIKSVIDYVDQMWILYSAIGSHGFRTSIPCPETRNELIAIARAVAGDKLRWVDGQWDYEGQQRDAIYKECPDADVIIVVDSDEIWDARWLRGLEVKHDQSFFTARKLRIPMVHFWRSFHRCIVHDPSFPVRIIIPSAPDVERDMSDFRDVCGVISHMGYAQPPAIIEYKLLTHGHRGQLRQGWFENIFMDENRQNDLHPVGSDAWNWESVNPYDYLPKWMDKHPYFNLDIIR